MKTDDLTFQVLFWSLIGPFISSLSLFVFYIKGDTTPDWLPLILLCGIPVCWYWRLKGFAGSLIALGLLFTYYYFSIPLEERFWHIGMAASISLSLLIIALACEEAEALLEGLKLESRSRLENLWKVDEKLQEAAADVKKKKEKIRELNLRVASYQKLLDRASEELVDLRTQQKHFEEEIYQTKKERDELVMLSHQIRGDSPLDQKYQQLRMDYEEQQKKLTAAQEQFLNLQKELEETKLYELSEVEQALEKQLLKTEKERQESDSVHEQELDLLQNALVSALEKEKRV